LAWRKPHSCCPLLAEGQWRAPAALVSTSSRLSTPASPFLFPLRSAVDDATAWRRLCARSFPSARLLNSNSSEDGAPPSPGRRSCVPPPRPLNVRPPRPPPPTRPTWKRLYQFHHTLLYRCLVRGGPPRGRPTVTRLAPGGAFFLALPLAVS